MEAGALLLLLFALSTTSTASFYGDSISFMTPKKNNNGTFTVNFHHRQNGRNSCEDQSSFTCDNNVCVTFNKSSSLQMDRDTTGQGRWCQSEVHTTAIISTNHTSFTLRDSGCCWLSNVNGKTDWTSHAELSLGTRSDTKTYNTCPVTATVSNLRVPQNCFTKLHLLSYDPDGDHVKCSFAPNTSVSSNITLDGTACTLMSSGQVQVGVHVLEVMLEDFPTKNITLTFANGAQQVLEASNMTQSPLCRVKLQFSVEILPSIPSCEAGHVQPMFLSVTPSQGDVRYATVGENFQLHVQAQAHHASIHDFQVSGPPNMIKKFTDETNGKAKVTLNWTPLEKDLHRFIPVCFTAETNETQSDMRCVVITVIQSSLVQGKATVLCSPNKMVVALEKASMPGIDMNYLKLRDESCSLTSNGTHIIGTMSFSTCGTKLEDKGDFMFFKNEINSFELPTEIIVRRRTVKIDFYCSFPKTIIISSSYNLHKSDYIFTESSFGSFGYTFEIYRDANFTDKVEASAYPVQVKLLQSIYMGIEAQSELPNVKLFVESCKGTPDDNPDNPISYDIIKNGCSQDETLKIYPSNQTTFNFEVQAFKFTGTLDQVYITCSVILCDSSSLFSRCAQGCVNSPSRRRRRDLSLETIRRSIVQGPLQFVGQEVPMATMEERSNSVGVKQSETPQKAVLPPVQPKTDTKSSEGRWDIMKELSSNVSTIVFASLFVVSVVLMIVVVVHFTRKRKAEDRQFLIHSDWDN